VYQIEQEICTGMDTEAFGMHLPAIRALLPNSQTLNPTPWGSPNPNPKHNARISVVGMPFWSRKQNKVGNKICLCEIS
jgi:hypothetical protein